MIPLGDLGGWGTAIIENDFFYILTPVEIEEHFNRATGGFDW